MRSSIALYAQINFCDFCEANLGTLIVHAIIKMICADFDKTSFAPVVPVEALIIRHALGGSIRARRTSLARFFTLSDFNCPQAAKISRPRGVLMGEA